MKRTIYAVGCIAFILCMTPVYADMVTLSVLHPGENSDTAMMGPAPVGYWTGADAYCLDVQGAELKDITFKLENMSQYTSISGAEICVNSGVSSHTFLGETLTAGQTIKIYYKNTGDTPAVINTEFFEYSSFLRHTWATIHTTVPAATTVTAQVQNSIHVNLIGNRSTTVLLAGILMKNSQLLFSPVQTPDVQVPGGIGILKSGNNVLQYKVSNASWNGISWTVDKVGQQTYIVFNPNLLNVAPGQYSGSMVAKIFVP